MTLFAALAALFTILAVGLVVWPLLRSRDAAHPLAATLTALVIPAVVLVVYLLVSNYDWRGAPAGSENPPASSGAAGSMEQAVAALEKKLEASPENEEGWILLGSSYLSLNRPADAAKAYQRALELSGGRSIDARLGVAEARIVLNPDSIGGPVGDEIEAVLQAEPRNPKALWYGGILSLARDQPQLARERWRALLELAPPERVRKIIESQLAALDAEEAPAAAAARAMRGPAAGPGVGVAVSLSDSLRAQASASAPLFVFLRDARTAGPPLAVIRRRASDLPLRLQITDADIMLPGRSLASVQSATLVARIANGGNPIAQPGDLYGEVQWQRNSSQEGPVAIVIDRVVER